MARSWREASKEAVTMTRRQQGSGGPGAVTGEGSTRLKGTYVVFDSLQTPVVTSREMGTHWTDISQPWAAK